jgi:ABC-type transport system substrate-binding protein
MRSVWRLLAASSLLLTCLAAAQSRPQYGGTLHIALRIAPSSLDPVDIAPADSIARGSLTALIFDQLVTIDNLGHAQPALALSWQSDSANQHWQFWLRRGIEFHDGSAVTAEAVAASLRTANPGWSISASGDSVIVDSSAPQIFLPAELALARNAIARRIPGGMISGTGPFRVADWQPARKLTLTVNEGYWNGRPFMDGLSIDLGKNSRDQLVALDLGKTDILELAPEQVRRSLAEGHRVMRSQPAILIALLFNKDHTSSEDGHLREALSLAIDRTSIRNVLMQGQGEPASGLLPDWLTGYEFVFPSQFDLSRAQQLSAALRHSPWSLAYDNTDAQARLIAERIALNARDAGLAIQITTAASADMRLISLPIPSLNPQLALTSLASTLGLPQPKFLSYSVDDLLQAESNLLQAQRVIPLVHYPVAYALRQTVHGFDVAPRGAWESSDVWLGASKP